MSLSDLVDLIKTEARVEGSDNLDSWITALINELLLEYCLQKKYYELLITNLAIPTVAAQEAYDLPEDFNFIKLVRYTTSSGSERTLLPRTDLVETVGTRGLPRFYELVGAGQIKLLPYLDVPLSDNVYLDYYKYPDALETDDDEFPIPRLLNPVKQRAIYRTHVYNNSLQQAAALKGDSAETEARTHPPSN